MTASDWLLLLHQIPPKPAYLRAKIMRRLGQVGALAVKNSAYLLPEKEDTREDFEWIAEEIREGGGAAWLFRVEALSGLTREEMEESFRNLRAADYTELIQSARALLSDEPNGDLPYATARLTERAEQVKKIDFFHCALGDEWEAVMNQLRERERQGAADEPMALEQGRIWVTRTGVKVDRIGSAWLIRRFIDPHATFRFVDVSGYQHAAPEIRFDMYGGEFTHEGPLCTFEVLAARHNLAGQYPALQSVAEIVHDIDLKDTKYQRLETAGFSRMLEGLFVSTPSDEQRLERGSLLFDAIYESFAH